MPFTPKLARLALSLCAAALMAGCVTNSASRACAPNETNMVNDQIFLGTDTPSGPVSPQEWTSFLAESVTPRFPQGLTVWQASGQWRGNDGAIVREPSYVLNLVHPGDSVSETAVRDIRTEYQTRFRQEATLRVRQAACVSF